MNRLAPIAFLLLAFAGVVAQDEFDAYPTPAPTPYEWPTPDPTPRPTPDCDHTSDSAERFEAVRLLPPAKIRNFDLANIEYLHEDKHGIHVGKLTADAETVMPADIWKAYKEKYWWLLYCLKCGHIYTIVEVAPGQMRSTKATARKVTKP